MLERLGDGATYGQQVLWLGWRQDERLRGAFSSSRERRRPVRELDAIGRSIPQRPVLARSFNGGRLEQFKRCLVQSAAGESLKGFQVDGVVERCPSEKRHRREKLQSVNRSEDIKERAC